MLHFAYEQVFHFSRKFAVRLPLEGETISYRFAVILGLKSSPGEEAGIRDVYVLNRKSPPEDQGDAEPEPEEETEMAEPTEEVPVEETPVEETPEEVSPSEEAPLAEETPAEEAPAEEVVSEEAVAEEAPAEEAVAEEASPVEEVVEEAVVEEAVVEEVSEPEVTEEVVSEEVVQVEKKMTLEPESPALAEGAWKVRGTLTGFEPNEKLFIGIEKSTTEDNGWAPWENISVSLGGERTPAHSDQL